MIVKKQSKNVLKKMVFGCFFAIMGLLAGLIGGVVGAGQAYALPEESNVAVVGSGETQNGQSTETDAETQNDEDKSSNGDGCKSNLGAIGWLVCPVTGKLAEGVDFLYGQVEKFLTINPISAEDGSPIYEIWKYCLTITNVVFIIFLIVVIYSQITGFGISNYGIKKALPKLIVTAIMVNLSFLICSLAVDVSNVVGNGITGLFKTMEQTVASSSEMTVSMGSVYRWTIGGSALAVGAGVIAFESGMIWMLIPVALGAAVAVAMGLFMIALRQAVVVMLIMVAPLAFVACILPNTDGLFKKWKQLLIKMLTFYPLFAILFGASSLAGFAIMMSATSGFGVILGIAVQIFPLFFSVSLMKMSGTFLGGIYSKMHGLASGATSRSRAWADSHRQLSKQRHLASGRAYTPSMALMGFLAGRRIAREAEMNEHAQRIKERGMRRYVESMYKGSGAYGAPSRKGERAYRAQAESMENQVVIARHKNNMNKGLGYLAAEGTAQRARLDKLDVKNVKAADALFAESVRGERIEYDNAMGRHKRFEDAINAHFDAENKYTKNEKTGELELDTTYKMHNIDDRIAAEARYGAMKKIMEGDVVDVQYVAASAAHGYDTQKKIIETKYQKYFELTPPTKDVDLRLSELTTLSGASNYIDAILPGLRILNQRGDTDMVRKQLENVLNSAEGVRLGTHASQALASFLMFEVKDSDPFLRRFGKYINLETAQVYNKNKRQNEQVTLNEYITGEYDDWEQGEPTKRKTGKSKRAAAVLLEGTSLDNVERTAFSNLDDMLKNAYTKDKKLDEEAYFAKRSEIESAIGPAFISASLKYLSGSEQMKNAVSFLTGYGLDGEPRWGEGGDLAGSERAERYFREKTLKYVKDQTPSQILGMRSDYRDAMMEHLTAEYFDKHPDEKAAFDAEVAEIQTRYGDEDGETAQKKRKADVNKLKMEKAGAQMREILGSTGKLEQIYRTRRSGAANNAKDWLRGWLDLDNEVAINDYLKSADKQKRSEFTATVAADPNSEDNVIAGGFGRGERAYFATVVRGIYDSWNGVEDGRFYEESVAWVKGELRSVADVILKKYEDFHRANPNADDYTLMEYLQSLLQDPNNY